MPSNKSRLITKLISEASEALNNADTYLTGDLFQDALNHAKTAVEKIGRLRDMGA